MGEKHGLLSLKIFAMKLAKKYEERIKKIAYLPPKYSMLHQAVWTAAVLRLFFSNHFFFRRMLHPPQCITAEMVSSAKREV